MTHTIPKLDSSTASKLRRIKWIVSEWERGCSCAINPETGDKLPPEACYECTEGAVVAIESLLK